MKHYVVINHYILSPEIEQLAINAVKSFKDTADCIVVSVDDGSPIKSETLKEFSDVWIPRETNGGFAVSANTGLQWVLDNEKDECYVTYANNDIEAYGGWKDEVVRCFDEYHADAVAGLGYRTRDFPKRNDHYVSEGGKLDDFMFSGGFFTVKASLLRECGLYDEMYVHGGIEDIDLFWRWKQSGKRLIITPRLQFFHVEGATRYSGTQKEWQKEAIKANEAYFKAKWGFSPIKNLFSKILLDNRINP
ncbi:MAG: glycosyltransferase family 2 protein [Minisyncoccota bacterium]